MTASFSYEGPRVDRGERARSAVQERVRRFVTRRAHEIYEQRVAEWAGRDSGAYPELHDCLREARSEAHVLFSALGLWAAVPPERVMPSYPPARRRPLPPWSLDL